MCMAIMVLWVRSYWIEDNCIARYYLHYFRFASYRGEMGIEFGVVYGGGPPDLYTPTWDYGWCGVPTDGIPSSDYIHIAEAGGRFKNMPHYHDVLGFRWHPRIDGTWQYKERGIAVPAWFAVGVTGMVPAIWAWRFAGRRRIFVAGGFEVGNVRKKTD